MVCLSVFLMLPEPLISQDANATQETVVGTENIEFFSAIVRNNIFDPNRRPYRPPEQRQERPVTRTPRVDTFGLNGIMKYNGKQMAIFNGSSSSFRGIRNQGEKIGEFAILEVGIDRVTLIMPPDPASGTQENVILEIGQSMQKEEENPWKKISSPAPQFSSKNTPDESRTSSRNPRSSPAPKTSPTTDEPAADENDILKKLLERRRLETQ
jgi:hypothetical protein